MNMELMLQIRFPLSISSLQPLLSISFPFWLECPYKLHPTINVTSELAYLNSGKLILLLIQVTFTLAGILTWVLASLSYFSDGLNHSATTARCNRPFLVYGN